MKYTYNSILMSLMYLPSFLRKARTRSVLNALLKPVESLLLMFNQFQINTSPGLYCTGQTIWLEKRLNDLFNNGNEGIFISDGEFVDPFYVSNRTEGFLPVYLHNEIEIFDCVYLRNNVEFEADADFYVNIPQSLFDTFDAETFDRLNAVIKKYKLLHFNYAIQTYVP